jgi:hypothetical protein
MFGKHYDKAPACERVKYGVLNFLKDPKGLPTCTPYGRSFFKLKNVKFRTTFAGSNTSGNAGEVIATLFHYAHILKMYSDAELIALHDIASKKI